MNKQRIIVGGIAGLLLLLAAATAAFWTVSKSPESQQITETTVATRNEDNAKINKISQPQPEAKVEKPAMKPIKDVFVYSFEGDKVYIVAGSVTVDKKNHQWQAKIKNVNKRGESQPVQVVSFKQEGTQILTRNDGGKWRSIDEMDRSLFDKVVDISETY